MTKLYKKDANGKIRVWQIRSTEEGIFTSDGLLNGKMKEETFKEAITNKQFKTKHSKAIAMEKSAITKKLRSNYFDKVENIKEEDILFMCCGCPSGMIWEEWKDKNHVVYPALASPKLDGSKMYSTWRDGRVFLNTRSAKEHKNFRHIEEALADFYETNPNIVLDGEAYNHEYADRFEELQSIFRKENPTEEQRQLSKKIAKFYIYDAIDLNKPKATALERQQLLSWVFTKLDREYLIPWFSDVVLNEEQYNDFHEICMNKGFEGSVLKISDAPYVQRKNKNVMKRKPKFDCEFLIMNIIEGSGTTKGVAGSVVIGLATNKGMNEEHSLKLDNKTQEAGFAKGWNHKMLKEMLENKADYIGKMGTIEYGGITAYGKLRFPKFKAIRID